MLPLNILSKYEQIKFLERYERLSGMYQDADCFEDFENDEILKIFKNLELDFSYNKKENFFSKREIINDMDFRLNLSLKYGKVEIIMWGKNTQTNEEFGGPLIRVIKLIKMSYDNNDVIRIPYPCFSNYKEFEEIVHEVILLYNDFKKKFSS